MAEAAASIKRRSWIQPKFRGNGHSVAIKRPMLDA
jgi:hypothetical protein